MQLRRPSDPRVTRSAVELADRGVRDQPPHNRVLPPATTDNKYSHATGAYPLTRGVLGVWVRGGGGDDPAAPAAPVTQA
jgi:hypothetical protein